MAPPNGGDTAAARDIYTEDFNAVPQRPVRKVVRITTPVAQPIPAAPGFAETGLMAPSPPTFLQRNASMMGISAIVVVTFILGLSTAYIMLSADTSEPLPLQAAFSAPTQMLDPVAEAASSNATAETATRAASPDLTDVSGPAPQLPQNLNSASDNAAVAVLAGFQPEPASQEAGAATSAQSLQVLSANKLRALREGVLAGLYNVEVIDVDGVQRVTVQGLNVDFASTLEYDVLLEAVNGGRIEMGLSLRTPDGGLDTNTMVFEIVQRSLFDDKSIESIAAARDMSRRVFAASQARTADVGGLRLYTVMPGDSLAYISLQFYGVPSAYTRIMDANRDTLQSPDKIQVGQRLIIPS